MYIDHIQKKIIKQTKLSLRLPKATLLVYILLKINIQYNKFILIAIRSCIHFFLIRYVSFHIWMPFLYSRHHTRKRYHRLLSDGSGSHMSGAALFRISYFPWRHTELPVRYTSSGGLPHYIPSEPLPDGKYPSDLLPASRSLRQIRCSYRSVPVTVFLSHRYQSI